MFLGLGPYDADPAQNIIAAGQELDDRDLSDLSVRRVPSWLSSTPNQKLSVKSRQRTALNISTWHHYQHTSKYISPSYVEVEPHADRVACHEDIVAGIFSVEQTSLCRT